MGLSWPKTAHAHSILQFLSIRRNKLKTQGLSVIDAYRRPWPTAC